MGYHLETREEIKAFVSSEILTAKEAMQLLEIQKSQMSKLVQSGKLQPIKTVGAVNLFLKSDVLQRKENKWKR